MPGNAGVDLDRRQLARIGARVPNRQRLANQLGITRSTLSRMLSGHERPSRRMLEQVCDALGLTVEVRTIVEIRPKGAPRRWGLDKD